MTDMNKPLEEILSAIRREEGRSSYAALLRWQQQYPEHREALENFFAAWAMEPDTSEENAVDAVGVANRLVSYALGLVHARREAAESSGREQAQLRLVDAARQRGISTRELAARLRLDEHIILKLDLRRVRNVPQLLLFWIANVVGPAWSPFGQMVTGPPLMAAGTRHKARGRPKPTMEDFVDSVRNSSLPEADKLFWYDVVAADRDHGDVS